MSLENAILGFLNYEPMTGYDLKRIFDSTVSHFWNADQSQIYRSLNRLTQQGYVTMMKEPQATRPDRKVYSITPTGREVFKDWLTRPTPQPGPHQSSLIQVFFAGSMEDSQILERFEAYAGNLRFLLKQYETIPIQISPFRDKIKSSREQFFWRLTLENGILSIQKDLEWAESVIERIKSGTVPKE